LWKKEQAEMKKAFSGFAAHAGLTLLAFLVIAQTGAGQTVPVAEGKTIPVFRPRRENPQAVLKPSDDPEDNLILIFRPLSTIRKEIREKLKLTDSDKDNYRKMAGDKKANIARILSSFSCSTSMVVDVSDPRCLENPDFSVGSYYSFRYKDYGESPWTDVSFIEGEFSAGNKWHTVGFLADLGETADFDKLDGKTEEIKALWELPSAETIEEKTKLKKELETGFTSGRLFLTSKMKAQANHTYMLRTISYRMDGGFQTFRAGFNWYNTDSLFVFKIVEMDAEKNATVAWKKIFQKVAPVLSDKEKDKDK
jgi:hypothetical protein